MPLVYAKLFREFGQVSDNSSVFAGPPSPENDSSHGAAYSRGEAEMWELAVAQSEDGLRADELIGPRFPLLSRTKLRVLFTSGAVTCNGAAITSGRRVRCGDRLTVRWTMRSLPPLIPEALDLAVVWEDEHFAAIDKPSGMLMHPTRSVKRGTLANGLLHLWNPGLEDASMAEKDRAPVVWPRFVHRLDRGTSGIVIAAKSAAAAAALGNHFAARQVRKGYLAILCGTLDLEQRVDAPVARVREHTPQWWVDEAGASATSIFRPLCQCGARTLAALFPLSGRTNQLRIHAAWRGTPILGDSAYGGESASRLCLHAWALDFAHPFRGEIMHVEAPIPPVFGELWPGHFPPLFPGSPNTQVDPPCA